MLFMTALRIVFAIRSQNGGMSGSDNLIILIMKRTILIMVLALVSALAVNAQDRIFFNDSRIVDAVIDEVGDNYVYYRLYGNPNGPVCSTATYNVFKIVYENGEEQFFTGGSYYYDERLFLDENMRALLGGQPVKMRFNFGNLYLGSRSRYGAMQADYLAFNLYGDDYYAAKRNWTWGSSLTWAGSMMLFGGFTFWAVSGLEGGALLTGVGAACLGAGIPLWVNGSKRLKGIADDYNSRYSGSGKSTELTFGPCPSGIGLALNF